ncbi:MAG: hypothetical protein RL637_972 [Pseudomonadota bacterium]|jgi:PTH1 family peptidyl-tRNA hydrolase
MIKLIVGLGNPGLSYQRNRHNAGFLLLDQLALQFSSDWKRDSKFQALTSHIVVGVQKVVLLKPQTYMNRSGQAVGQAARYYDLLPDQILVVHDELDFAVGLLRLKYGGGHAGHNGLRDIITHLTSKDFYRLRVGIGRPVVADSVANYVLSNFSLLEMQQIIDSYRKLECYWEQMIIGEFAEVMNQLHGT